MLCCFRSGPCLLSKLRWPRLGIRDFITEPFLGQEIQMAVKTHKKTKADDQNVSHPRSYSFTQDESAEMTDRDEMNEVSHPEVSPPPTPPAIEVLNESSKIPTTGVHFPHMFNHHVTTGRPCVINSYGNTVNMRIKSHMVRRGRHRVCHHMCCYMCHCV